MRVARRVATVFTGAWALCGSLWACTSDSSGSGSGSSSGDPAADGGPSSTSGSDAGAGGVCKLPSAPLKDKAGNQIATSFFARKDDGIYGIACSSSTGTGKLTMHRIDCADGTLTSTPLSYPCMGSGASPYDSNLPGEHYFHPPQWMSAASMTSYGTIVLAHTTYLPNDAGANATLAYVGEFVEIDFAGKELGRRGRWSVEAGGAGAWGGGMDGQGRVWTLGPAVVAPATREIKVVDRNGVELPIAADVRAALESAAQVRTERDGVRVLQTLGDGRLELSLLRPSAVVRKVVEEPGWAYEHNMRTLVPGNDSTPVVARLKNDATSGRCTFTVVGEDLSTGAEVFRAGPLEVSTPAEKCTARQGAPSPSLPVFSVAGSVVRAETYDNSGFSIAGVAEQSHRTHVLGFAQAGGDPQGTMSGTPGTLFPTFVDGDVVYGYLPRGTDLVLTAVNPKTLEVLAPKSTPTDPGNTDCTKAWTCPDDPQVTTLCAAACTYTGAQRTQTCGVLAGYGAQVKACCSVCL